MVIELMYNLRLVVLHASALYTLR